MKQYYSFLSYVDLHEQGGYFNSLSEAVREFICEYPFFWQQITSINYSHHNTGHNETEYVYVCRDSNGKRIGILRQAFE